MKNIISLYIAIIVCVSCKNETSKSSDSILQPVQKEVNLLALETMVDHHATASKTTYLGRDAIKITAAPDHKSIEEGGCDNCTFVILDNTNFKNGTIEIDMAGKPGKSASTYNRGFVGIVFRVNDNQTHYEGFYLRPGNAKSEARKHHTIQYFSAPDYPWHVLRETFPNTYEGYADITVGEWQKLKVTVQGNAAKFFVNGKTVLEVDSLFQGKTTGKIGLFTEPDVDAYFSNLKIKADN